MNNPLLQLLVLAGIAIFLILRLRNVLGTRGGYEPPQVDAPDAPRPRFDVIEGTADEADHDILDHAEAGSQTARALAAMKTAEPSFGVMDFLNGAKSADARAANGHTVTAQYIGTRETALTGAEYDPATGMAEVSVRFVGELIAATRDAAGNVVEGDPKAARKQRDTWTFARRMGQDDPNWQLVATG